MGSQRTTKATKMKMSDKQKNLNAFLLNSERPFQDLAFSTRIQDWIPRDIQRHEKENVCRIEKPSGCLLKFKRFCRKDRSFTNPSTIPIPIPTHILISISIPFPFPSASPSPSGFGGFMIWSVWGLEGLGFGGFKV